MIKFGNFLDDQLLKTIAINGSFWLIVSTIYKKKALQIESLLVKSYTFNQRQKYQL